jgi:hypothetical protein
MSKDLGKLILERLQVQNAQNSNKTILSEQQLKIVLGENKNEQQRSGKG